MNNRRLTSYYFAVELDGIDTVSFTECTGLTAETTIYEVEEGGYNTSTHNFIGQSRYPNLVLRGGISKSNLLHNWCKNWFNQGSNDKVERKSISIVLYNSARKEMFRWNLFRCFPCRWKVETLDVKDNSYAIEMLEIAYEDMEVDGNENYEKNTDTFSKLLAQSESEEQRLIIDTFVFVGHGTVTLGAFDSIVLHFGFLPLRRVNTRTTDVMRDMENHMRRFGGVQSRLMFNGTNIHTQALLPQDIDRILSISGGMIFLSRDTQPGIVNQRQRFSNNFYFISNTFQEPANA